MGTPHILMLLLLAGIMVVSAKPHRAPSYERLHNLRGLFDSIGETFNGLGDTLSDTASKVGHSVGNSVNDLGETLSDTASNVGDTVGDTFNDWGETLSDTAGNVDDTVNNWVDVSSDITDDVDDYFGDTFIDWGETLSDTAVKVGDAVNNWGDSVIDAAGDVHNFLSGGLDPHKRAWKPVRVEGIIPEQREQHSDLTAAILPPLREERLYNRRGWVDGWGDTLSDWGNSMADAVDDAKDELADAFHKRQAVGPKHS